MPQAVVHVLLTIIIIDLYRDYILKDKKGIPLRFILYGGLAGLLPDIDVPISWLASMVTGMDSLAYHRTITHTLLFLGIFILVAAVVQFESRKYAILWWFIAFGVGFHILLDAIFVEQVMLFYPFSDWQFGLNLFSKTGLGGFIEGIEAIILIAWLWHEQSKHRISDYI